MEAEGTCSLHAVVLGKASKICPTKSENRQVKALTMESLRIQACKY